MSHDRMFTESDASQMLSNAYVKYIYAFEEGDKDWQIVRNYYAGIPAKIVALYDQLRTESEYKVYSYTGEGLINKYRVLSSFLLWDPSKSIFSFFIHDMELDKIMRAYLTHPGIDTYLSYLDCLEKTCIFRVAQLNAERSNALKECDLNFDVDAWKKTDSELQELPDRPDHGELIYQHFEKLKKQQAACERFISMTIDKNYASIILSMLKAHRDYIAHHKNDIQQLFDHYFNFTTDGFIRRKDDLSKSWLDLMPTDYYFRPPLTLKPAEEFAHLYQGFQVLDSNNHDYLKLIACMNAYHQTPKDSADGITDRIILLRRIVKLSSEFKHPLIEEIRTRAALKVGYLYSIRKLNTDAIDRLFHIPRNKSGHAIVTCKEDQLLDLDPEKRGGIERFHEKWLSVSDNDPTTPGFFLWLELQDTSSLSSDKRHTLLTQDEKRVNFVNGKACNAVMQEMSGSHQFIADGRYVYNIDEDGELYIYPAFETVTKLSSSVPKFKNHRTYNHDTLLGGKNVLSAGIVIFQNGVIKFIDTNSGHYKPKMIRHLRPALQVLLSKYPDAIQSDTIISNYSGDVRMPYQEFLTATAEQCKEEAFVHADKRTPWVPRGI